MLMMRGIARRILVSTNMLKWWIMSSLPPVKATLLSGGLSGGLSVHPVWLCMWSSRERGSRFKVRSRGSSRPKIKQEARVRKLHWKRTGKRRMLLHVMKGKATSETDKVPFSIWQQLSWAQINGTQSQDKTKLKRWKKQAENLCQSLIQPDLENMNSELDWRPSLEHQACLDVQLSIVQLYWTTTALLKAQSTLLWFKALYLIALGQLRVQKSATKKSSGWYMFLNTVEINFG